MKALFRFSLLLCVVTSLICGLGACSARPAPEKKAQVLVTIPPYRHFVQRIVGGLLDVQVMVPPGVSVHHYEPTPRQVLDTSEALVWFRIGETFEGRVIEALHSHNPSMQVIDMREGLTLLESSHSHDHSHGDHEHDHHEHSHGDLTKLPGLNQDLHTWLSPRLVQEQSKKIASTLISLFPEHRETFSLNLDTWLKELQALDEELSLLLAKRSSPYVLVSHDAFAYFCHDYDLEQISIEWKGKDPTAQQLGHVLELARNEQITHVFVIPQHSRKGAELIADELNLEIVEIDPHDEDYIQNLRNFARSLSLSGKE